MSKTYIEYQVKFYNPVDCYGDYITESTVVALNKQHMNNIIKENYFKDSNEYTVISEKEVELFVPNKQFVYENKATDLDETFINPIKIIDPMDDNND